MPAFESDTLAESISLYCISMSHKNTPAEVRHLFSFSDEEATSLLKTLFVELANGCVLISTCNRTELYFSPKSDFLFDTNETLAKAQFLLSKAKAQEAHLFRKFCFSYTGADAIRHLFSVASGLDSMVLGENEILGQLRESYKRSATLGLTDFFINFVFQRALSCAKIVKTKTNLSKSTESIATLAVKEIGVFKKNVSENVTVLLIGASGQTGGIIAKNLSEREGVRVFATVRRHYGLPELPNVQKIKYDERYSYIERADVVVSATKSPHYTLSFGDVFHSIQTKKARLFIDLAVPNDIDPDVQKIENVKYVGIDCFASIAKAHGANKKLGEKMAKSIILEETDKNVKELLFHNQIDFIQEFASFIEKKSARQFLFEMRNVASSSELSVLLSLWKRIKTEAKE